MTVNKLPPGPAAIYKHQNHQIKNVNEEFELKLSWGQRVADKVTAILGSWPFIIVQSFFLLSWIAVNIYLAAMVKNHPDFLKSWDPYPFILLNLVLSFQAAYTGPVVMMSQNRQVEKDRLEAQHDFEINKKAEEEIEVLMKHLIYQDNILAAIISKLENNQPTGRNL
ncbi:MAG: DUF1003 domain-containing protein [Firmicutes bacterium]|nr:DUF1003 domain-containing protein [Bacillota bacterium]